MNFCANCGAPVGRYTIETEGFARNVCAKCGQVYFENPKVLVACLAYCGNRLVLCRRAHEPAAGLWVPPGGFVEMAESLEAAAVREAREEAGLILDPRELIPCAITSLSHLSEIYITFRVAISGANLVAGKESLEVGLFSEQDAPWNALAFPGTDQFLRIFFRELQSGEFSLHLGAADESTRSKRSFPLQTL